MDTLIETRPDTVRLATPVAFGANTTPIVALVNFSEPENGFVWSLGPWCEMRFDLDIARPEVETGIELTLDANVFAAPPKLPGQTVIAYLNGHRIGSAWVTGRGVMMFKAARVPLLREGNTLTLDVPNATSPATFGQPDERRLGVKVFSLTVHPVA
jgi:hypothetical protein